MNLLDEFTKEKIYEMVHIYNYKDVLDELKEKTFFIKTFLEIYASDYSYFYFEIGDMKRKFKLNELIKMRLK